jgi:hypothetical protein
VGAIFGRNNIRRDFAKPRMAFPLGAGKSQQEADVWCCGKAADITT